MEKLGWERSPANTSQVHPEIFEHIGQGKEGLRNYDPETTIEHFLKAIELDKSLNYGKVLLGKIERMLVITREGDEVNDSLEEQDYQRALDRLLQNVEFRFDSARLLRSSYHSLNLAVELLKNHPEVELLIEGHTESIGLED